VGARVWCGGIRLNIVHKEFDQARVGTPRSWGSGGIAPDFDFQFAQQGPALAGKHLVDGAEAAVGDVGAGVEGGLASVQPIDDSNMLGDGLNKPPQLQQARTRDGQAVTLSRCAELRQQRILLQQERKVRWRWRLCRHAQILRNAGISAMSLRLLQGLFAACYRWLPPAGGGTTPMTTHDICMRAVQERCLAGVLRITATMSSATRPWGRVIWSTRAA